MSSESDDDAYESDGGLDYEPEDEADAQEKGGAVEPDDEAVEPDEDIEVDSAEPEPEEEEEAHQVSKYNREIIIVRPENRRTPNVLSKYEMTEIVSIRATGIAQYSNCMVDITGLDDPIKMAKRELMMRKCPLILRRPVGEVIDRKTNVVQSYVEDWVPSEMAFSVSYPDVM